MSRERSHITPEQYQKYLNGELSASEAYEIERLLQSTPLYDEALDGLEMLDSKTLSTDIDSLKKEIPLPAKEKKKKNSWLKIAAMITLLIVGIPVLWLIVDQQQSNLEMLSDQQEKEVFTEESTATKSPTENLLTEKSITKDNTNNASDEKTIDPNSEANQQKIQKPSQIKDKSKELIDEALANEPVAEVPLITETIEEDAVLEEVIAFTDEVDMEVMEEAEIMENAGMEEKTINTRTNRIEANKKRRPKKASSRSVVGSGRNSPLNTVDLSDSMDNSDEMTEDLKYLLVEDTAANNFEPMHTILMPVPADGEKSFEKYLKENNLLLKKKRRHKPATISFLVQPDSTITDVHLIEGDSLQFDQISKIILNGPKWIPTDSAISNRVRLILWKKNEKK